MPRATTTAPVSWATDADFRTSMAELITLLTTAGFVQTSDTGQINTSTAVRPTANNFTEYLIFRFNDSFQATSPIVIKIEIGAGSSQSAPRGRITVGSGSNGSGTITGVYVANMLVSNASNYQAGNWPSYAVHKDGYGMLCYKSGAISSELIAFGFIIQRTVDNTGEFTSDGLTIICPAGAFSGDGYVYRVRFTPILDISGNITGRSLAFIPGSVLDSRVSLAPQLFQHWIMMPRQRPLVASCSSVRGELSLGQQFSALLVGAVPRNYLHLGGHFGNMLLSAVGSGNPYGSISVLWED